MIELHQTIKKFEKVIAFSSENLRIDKGEVLGVVGNNGAGKTTMLRLLLDLSKPTSGYITSKEKPVFKSDHWKAYTGSYLDEGFLIPFLRPMEYMEFVASINGIPENKLKDFLSWNKAFYGEELFKGKKLIRDLSRGNKAKVGILGAMLHEPEILILDEPFANLDPGSQSWLKWKLEDLNARGTTMIISSHDLRHITEITSRIIVLEAGKIVEDCKTNEDTLSKLESYFTHNFKSVDTAY